MAVSVDDATFTQTCAVDLLIYDAEPVGRWINRGSHLDPVPVARHEALIEIYARRVLVQCEADPDRLRAVQTECARRREGSARSPSGDERITGLGHADTDESPPPQTTVPSSPSRPEQGRIWSVAEKLITVAMAMVVEAGAVDDFRARARLLVSAAHTTAIDRLGSAVPTEVRQKAAWELARLLGEIDDTSDGHERDPNS